MPGWLLRTLLQQQFGARRKKYQAYFAQPA
jgi:hypothetical protein